jgi:methylglutaconyl-CoA hydratase
MSKDLVIFRRHSEEVAESILNRPEKRNALNIALMRQLCEHTEQIRNDGKTRIWILQANGPTFCAGLDIGEVMDPTLGIESARMVKQCLSSLYGMPVVTMAMVRGAARGGGAGLIAACDFAIADKDATIGFPEVRLGLIPAQVMTLLVRKLKPADVRELALSGEPIVAERALQMGIFQRVGDIEAETQAIVSRILLAAPGALTTTKQLIDHLQSRRLQDDIEMCMHHYLQAREGTEALEGIRAFLERRKPSWAENRQQIFISEKKNT